MCYNINAVQHLFTFIPEPGGSSSDLGWCCHC